MNTYSVCMNINLGFYLIFWECVKMIDPSILCIYIIQLKYLTTVLFISPILKIICSTFIIFFSILYHR